MRDNVFKAVHDSRRNSILDLAHKKRMLQLGGAPQPEIDDIDFRVLELKNAVDKVERQVIEAAVHLTLAKLLQDDLTGRLTRFTLRDAMFAVLVSSVFDTVANLYDVVIEKMVQDGLLGVEQTNLNGDGYWLVSPL
jgi:hypothetical protein